MAQRAKGDEMMTDDGKPMEEETRDSMQMLAGALVYTAALGVVGMAFVLHVLVTGRWL